MIKQQIKKLNPIEEQLMLRSGQIFYRKQVHHQKKKTKKDRIKNHHLLLQILKQLNKIIFLKI